MKHSVLQQVLLFGCSIAATGCWGWMRADLGAVSSTTLREGRQGGAISADIGGGDKHDPVGLDIGFRAKVTGSTGDGALFVGAMMLHAPEPVGVYALAGTNLIQLGGADGDFSFGMFSPSAEIGILLGPDPQIENGRFSDPTASRFLLGAGVQYDLRFTDQPHEGFFLVKLGFAKVTKSN